jgi:hypothetical protein
MKAVVPGQRADADFQASLPARGVDAGFQASLPARGVDAGFQTSLSAQGVDASLQASLPAQGVDAGLQASLPARGVDADRQIPLPAGPASGIGDPSNMIDLTGSDNEQADGLQAAGPSITRPVRSTPTDPVPPRPAPSKQRAPVGSESLVADPIEWVLHIPTSDGHRLENFEALPVETRAALTSKYNDVFCALPDIPGRGPQEVRRHYLYVRYFDTSNREMKANSKHCVKQGVYHTSKERPCRDDFACVRCRTKPCPCARTVTVVDDDGTSKHKLCFFPFKKPAGGETDNDAWKAVEFWTTI